MIGDFLRLIKVEHTLFALPLALAGAVLGARGMPSLRVLGLVALAFAAARASAMTFNRLVDHGFDARNPRTADRELPRGKISRVQAGLLTAICAVLFLISAWAINPLCGKLAPLALIIILGYSYTKRFTMLSHYVLGLALGIAPIAGWISVTGALGIPPLFLGAGVLLWTAGFDTLYACQDVDFDRKEGLYSLPAMLGIERAIMIARASHVAAFLLFLATGLSAGLLWPFYAFITLTGALLFWEHRLVGPGDLSRLDMAFFRINSMVSGSILLAVVAGRV
jgi:4-hydroxybenzoate polyprenyltransferase